MQLFFNAMPQAFWVIFWFVLSLCVGSFLNVVIARVPQMLLDDNYEGTLSMPRSHCPGCQTTLRWYHNIPLLSFAGLKGQCHHCSARISFQYPCVEFVSAIMAAMLVFYFGMSIATLAMIAFGWFMIALFMIDVQTYLLPDSLTLPLLWLGLLLNSQTVFVPLINAVYGAVLGYALFWLVSGLYRALRKQEGLGLGDAKLTAAIGACVGVMHVSWVIAAGAVLALLFAIIQLCRGKITLQRPLPFGPFLALVGAGVLIAVRVIG